MKQNPPHLSKLWLKAEARHRGVSSTLGVGEEKRGVRAENRDLDHPGGSPASNFSPEMSHRQEFWVERGQAEGRARRRPRHRTSRPHVRLEHGLWEAVRASTPTLAHFHPHLGTAEHLSTGPAGPRVSPDPGRGRRARRPLTLGSAYFGSFIRTKSLRR